MKVSYGLTVYNEDKELQHLIEYLTQFPSHVDEIVIVYDNNRVTKEVLKVLEKFKDNVSAHPFDFKENFLENKNYMNSLCTGDYIFQIDADEIPSEVLVINLKSILENNLVDVIEVPRKNLVKGLTQEHIQKWRWNVNEKGWVNWPDSQKRIYRNTPEIAWRGHQIHGMVTGYKSISRLPLEEHFSIIHNKEIQRQESQNERYDNIQKTIINA